MNALKTARKLINAHPESQAAITLAQLIQALQCERKINLLALYALKSDDFKLAIDVLKQWRIDRRAASSADAAIHRSGANPVTIHSPGPR